MLLRRDEGLPVSLFAPYKNLPEEGRVRALPTLDMLLRLPAADLVLMSDALRAGVVTRADAAHRRR